MDIPAFGAEALARRVAQDWATVSYPARDWVAPVTAPDGGAALDCAIIGAGQYGLALSAALRRERVERILAFDAAEEGREGPWVTFARMEMLRTPKDLTGPDLGIPSLSFRAYWDALHGEGAWDALFRIPRTAWMDYLRWYRRVLDLPVRNRWRLTCLMPEGDLFALAFDTPDGARRVFARTVVLATGASGSGGHAVPPHIAAAVPAERLHHANDVFDLSVMAGQRVGVLGNGASAFDIATAALKAGAVSADLCFRRAALPRDNPRRWMENAGFLDHYIDLPDARKWAYLHRLGAIGQPPPQPTFEAALAQPGFRMHPGTPWERIAWTGGEIIVEGGGKRFAFDRVVAATGFQRDLSALPELAEVLRHAALWSDRYAPPPELASPRLAASPYLDRHGAFTEREPGAAPWLARVFTISGAATLSLGPVAASNSGMKYVLPRIVSGVKRQLLLAQEEADWAAFLARDHGELPA
jgi:cation diffusion facilitator CzcD-associated flavoprotein CzcO